MAYTQNELPDGLDALTSLDSTDVFVVGDQSDSDRAKKITKANILIDFADETQTLTNKTINTASNTITVLEADVSDLQSYITQVEDDSSPNLGGDLDVNGSDITSSSAGDITLSPDTTGNVILDGLNWPQADGTSGQVVTTNGAGQLSFSTPAGAGDMLIATYDPTAVSSDAFLTSNMNATADRLFYSDSSGDVQEITLGTSSQVLTSTGATSAPSFQAAAGGGNVSNTGTPVDNQLAVWTDATTVEGTTSLTFDSSTDVFIIGDGTTGSLALGGISQMSNSAGTTTLQNIDAIDATTETTFEAAIDSLTNLTVVGTLVTGNADAIISAASVTVVGAVELATAAETTTGTDATRAVTPDGLAGSDFGIRLIEPQVIQGATAVATGDGAGDYRFFVPAELNGYNLVSAHAAVVTAGTTGTMDIQINNVTQATDMLTTVITIDSTEKTSYTAATPPVIDAANDDVATGDEIRIDVDAIHTTPGNGLSIILGFQLP